MPVAFYRTTATLDTFSPEIHEWVVEVGGKYMFVMKDTDKFTPVYGALKGMTPTPRKDVPVHIRQKAGQRIGGARTAGHI